MAPKAGRLEARFTLAAPLTASFTDSGGATPVSVPAGDYYMAEFITAIDADLGGNWTISVSDGEGTPTQATGRVTITSSATPFEVAFTDAAMGTILGYTGNIASTSSPAVGANHCYGMWLPGAPAKFTRHGDGDPGTLVTDFRQLVSPNGAVTSLYGNKYRVINGMKWEGVPTQRVRTFKESITNESMETFILMTQFADGGASQFPVAAPIRIYWDADVDATYTVVTALWTSMFDPETMFRGWIGRYTIEMPQLVCA